MGQRGVDERALDYFENSPRATLVQRDYAVRNPRKFAYYNAYCWGITAGDGPGPAHLTIDGVARRFLGYKASFNPLYPGEPGKPRGWRSAWNYGINQGPIVLMIENYRSGMPWRLMRGCAPLAEGLRRVGFAGGWLG